MLFKKMLRQGILAIFCLVIVTISGIYCISHIRFYSPACRHGEVVARDVYDKGYMNLKLTDGEEEIHFAWDHQGNELPLKKGDAILVYGEVDTSAIGPGANLDVYVAGAVITYVMLGICILSLVGFIISVIFVLRSLKSGAMKQFSLSSAKENLITAAFGIEVLGLFFSIGILIVTAGILVSYLVDPQKHILTGEIISAERVKTQEVYYNSTTHSQTYVYEKTIVVELDKPFEGETQYVKTYRERSQTITKEGSFAFVVLRSLDDRQGKVYTLANFIHTGIAAVFLILHQILYRIIYAKGEKPPLMLITWKLLPGKSVDSPLDK